MLGGPSGQDMQVDALHVSQAVSRWRRRVLLLFLVSATDLSN